MPYADPEKRRACRKRGRPRIRSAEYKLRKHLRKKGSIRSVIEAAKSVPCMDCGNSYPAYVMDLDHVRGEKLCGVSQMTNSTVRRVLEEMAKCEVVCANCHRIRTFTRKQHLNPSHANMPAPIPQFSLDLH